MDYNHFDIPIQIRLCKETLQKAPSVNFTRAQLPECFVVGACSISLVNRKPVTGVPLVVFSHQPVPTDLREDGSRRNRIGDGVSSDDRLAGHGNSGDFHGIG